MYKKGGIYRQMFQKGGGGHGPGVPPPPPKSATGACVCVFRLVLLVVCLPVSVGETLHDPGSLGNKPFETRDLVPYMYYVAHCHNYDLNIVKEYACQSKTTQPNLDILVLILFLESYSISWYH